MIPSDNHTSDDFSLLDLFRSEVKSHGSILRDGISGMNDPGAPLGLDALISSVKTLYGGARIVGADDIAELTSVIRDCLVAIQSGKRQAGQDAVNHMIQGVDLLLSVADTESSELPSWFEQNRESIRRTIVGITEDPPRTEAAQPHHAVPGETTKKDSLPVKPVVENHVPEAPKEPSVMTSVIDDDGMLDLYMEEVITHTEVLNNGLLALEDSSGDATQLEALMRSAHSLKGGARVVGLNMAVDCAHVMEDCFVAAQSGRITLGSDHVDTLLHGVDMLVNLSEAAQARDEHRLVELMEENDRLVLDIWAISTGEAPSVPAACETAFTPVKTAASPLSQSTRQVTPVRETKDVVSPVVEEGQYPLKVVDKTRALRVSAEKIERLMGFAGEVVVGASWLPPFSESLLTLKRSHADLYAILSQLHDMFRGGTGEEDARKLIEEARDRNKESIQKLADRMTHLEKFTSSYATLSDSIYHEVISVRMRPFEDGVRKFPRLVRDVARQLDKKIQFEIRGKNTEVDRDILEKLDAPLTHLIQNALDHGIESREERLSSGKPESGRIVLQASHLSGKLMVTLSDDGQGIHLDDLRQKIVRKGMANETMVAQMSEYELLDFLFLPGFSTKGNVTQLSGRGVGLDVVHTMVRDVGGLVRAETKPGEGMTFILELPLTLSVIRTFLVEISDELYAFPLARIDRCLVLDRDNIETVEDREYFRFDGVNIALVDIHDVLAINKNETPIDEIMILVVSDRYHTYGLAVDKFLGEIDLVARPLDSRLGKVPNVDAAAIMLDGSPVLIIDVEDMVRSIDKQLDVRSLKKIGSEKDMSKNTKKRILVVDDSITVREMERKLLTNMGYDVEIAVDGAEGWNIVRSGHFDLVISDIDMPRMNGFEFVSHIKNQENLKSIPVIIISYKEREEDRMRGLEVGADYYLTKSSFEDNTFLDAVVDLIGGS